MKLRSCLLVAAVVLLPGVASAEAGRRIRGTVTSLDGYRLHVDDGGRDVTVTLAADYGIGALVAAKPDEVAPGRYVGALASRQANGVLTARELHIFPGNLRGAGAGQRPSDARPGSVAVTGTVDQGGLDALGGTMTLTYAGGEAVLDVPPDVPIVRFVAGARSMLAPGAHVVVAAALATDGTLKADEVIVGIDGVVPPM